MKLLKIKDNSRIKKTAFANIPKLTAKLANKPLAQLEREGVFVFPKVLMEADDLAPEQKVLQSVYDTYRTGNVMGFLGYADERLVIESRFSGSGEDYLSQYLLHRTLDFPNFMDMRINAGRDNQLFSFLLFLFPSYLKSAMRKGLFKTYIRLHYNDANVKGSIDIARHIAKNTPFVGNIAYSQREFSADNDLMELVRHTVEFIKSKPCGNTVLHKAKDEVRAVIEATPQYNQGNRRKIIARNKQRPLQHAYFKEYLALQRLCLMILQHEKHQIGYGTRQIYGILFDGAWLWEEYVNSLLGSLFYHPRNKKGEGAQRLFEHNIGLIYPDFISRDNEKRIIADAKYKPIENIGNRDYLQLLAYMFRFDAKKGYYLYPEAIGNDDVELYLNQGLSYEKNVKPRDDISIVKHGLKIPLGATSFDDFATKIQQSELEFKNSLLKINL